MTTYRHLSNEEIERKMADNHKELSELYKRRLKLQGDLQELDAKRVHRSSAEYRAVLKEIPQVRGMIHKLNNQIDLFQEELERRENAGEAAADG